MDPYGSVWTRMGPYGPWGLPGGFLGPPGALGGPKKGGKGGSLPGGPGGPSWEACLLALRGILTYTAAWPSYVVSEDHLQGLQPTRAIP